MSEEEDLKYLQTEYEENIITELIKKVESLQNQLQQKENIIKEVREILLIYGETFDNKIHQEMQNKFLKILGSEIDE